MFGVVFTADLQLSGVPHNTHSKVNHDLVISSNILGPLTPALPAPSQE